jgi:hypothetical protein
MKKLFLFLMFLPLFTFAQKITSPKNEINELKEVTGVYVQVTIQGIIGKLNVAVETNLEGYWRFIDENGKEMKFNTNTDLLNFMHKNGWEFKQFIRNDVALVSFYVFERRN